MEYKIGHEKMSREEFNKRVLSDSDKNSLQISIIYHSGEQKNISIEEYKNLQKRGEIKSVKYYGDGQIGITLVDDNSKSKYEENESSREEQKDKILNAWG